MKLETYKEIMDFYSQQGIGLKMGFGDNPAILVIDFIRAFTDSSSPLGSNLDNEISNSLIVLDVARKFDVPIIFTTVWYENNKDAGIWLKKAPSATILAKNSKWVEIDARLQYKSNEFIIIKKFASAFFGTNLINLLTTQKVDTLILLGCTTSGCIRATAIDSLQYGFYTIIPEECVGRV